MTADARLHIMCGCGERESGRRDNPKRPDGHDYHCSSCPEELWCSKLLLGKKNRVGCRQTPASDACSLTKVTDEAGLDRGL